MFVTIQLRRGTSSQWDAVDPVLGLGEPGLDSTQGIVKIGDGASHWSELTQATLTAQQINDINDLIAGGGGGGGGGGGSLAWADITGKPATFAPAPHNHDSLYYGQATIDSGFAEVTADLNDKAPADHNHDFPAINQLADELDTKVANAGDPGGIRWWPPATEFPTVGLQEGDCFILIEEAP